MKDHTLWSPRTNTGLDRGVGISEEQTLCCIPHCNRLRADNVGIHLCPRHIEKAWAAHQILTGLAQVPETLTDPARDTTSLKAKGTVYFIRKGDLLKIGWTSRPEERMRALQPDAILHFQPGTRKDEAKMHARFVDHLVKGREWFEINDESMKLVQSIQYSKAA